MKKWLKISLIILGILVVLLGVVWLMEIIIVTMLSDKNSSLNDYDVERDGCCSCCSAGEMCMSVCCPCK